MNEPEPMCMRAGIEMTKAQWMALPRTLRERYWRETDWGSEPPSSVLIADIRAAFIAYNGDKR